jgi:hypothetical protein
MSAAHPDSLLPRLVSSRHWTDLPADFRKKVEQVFAEQFEYESTKGEFLVDGRIYNEEIILRIGYLEKGRLRQINFEASIDIPKAKKEDDSTIKTMDLLYTCIDALGSLMEDYFDLDEEEELDVPLHWRPYEFEDQTVYLQHSTVNTTLEAEADRLLGVGNAQLFNEDLGDEDALAKAEIDPELAFMVQKAIREGKVPEGFGQNHSDSETETENEH